jgi:hypothetical protein
MKRFPRNDNSCGYGAVIDRVIGFGPTGGSLLEPLSETAVIQNAVAAPASPVGGNWSSLYYKPTECMKDGLVMTLSTYHDEGKLDHQVVVALDAKATWDLYRRLCSLYRTVPAAKQGANNG